MIQPATLPVTTQLLLASDPPAEALGLKALETPFSALLEANIDASLTALGGEAAPVASRAMPARAVAAPATGKPGGKMLPDRLPIAAEAKTDIAALPVETADPELAPADVAAPLAVAPADFPVFAVLPAPAPGKTTTEPTTPLARQLLPQLAEAAAPVVRTPGQKLLARFTAASAAPLRAETARAGQLESTPGPAPAAAVVSALAAQPALLGGAIFLPLRLPTRDAASPLLSASAQPEASAPAAAPLVVQLSPSPISPAVATVLPANQSNGEPRAAADLPAPLTEQSAPALPDAAPQPGAATNPAALSAPVLATLAPAPAAPQHDFAALIDRLVEARQTAQATLAVQTVTAAVAHAEFGQVSLQFRQDGEGLSVVMAGNDPDLARAIQAAAPAGQAGMQANTGPDGSPPQRQDSTSQTQAQAQQQRGQSPQHRADDARGAANPTPRRSGPDDSSARGGIFA